MCGIVGMTSGKAVVEDLIAALGRMEYRGYDSAGIALSGGSGALIVQKVVGPVSGLAANAGNRHCRAGIAHTRWATHGRPELRNAHPVVSGGVAVVHNGIVENFQSIREGLAALGHVFQSDTDSEVIPHLMADALRAGATPMEALRSACARLQGTYAIAAVIEGEPELVLVARKNSPVVVGRADGLAAVASDTMSLGGYCTEYLPLEDGEMAELRPGSVRVTGPDMEESDRAWQRIEGVYDDSGTQGFAHYTRKEIAEQPAALRRTDEALRDRALPPSIAAAERLVLVACGSSLFAATAARGFVERLSGIPCDLEVASEFRYREAPLPKGSVAVLVSQSGETADTMAALDLFREAGVPSVAIVNVLESSIARGADLLWPTSAGHEMGVAATKTFTSQMLAIIRLGLRLGAARGMGGSALASMVDAALAEAPGVCALVEEQEPALRKIAQGIARENEALFVGRGWGAAIAAEGALKLKELSYMRADAYASGELKHGPIALIREGSPVIVHAPSDVLLHKTVSNAEEVRARGAHIIALTDADAVSEIGSVAAEIVVLPGTGPVAVFAHAVAVQLIAYHTSLALGRNVDRPRNLAKSVTVE
jgi:glucosamine--fructose-6-phosphate aminotransferase (isomerizing)